MEKVAKYCKVDRKQIAKVCRHTLTPDYAKLIRACINKEGKTWVESRDEKYAEITENMFSGFLGTVTVPVECIIF